MYSLSGLIAALTKTCARGADISEVTCTGGVVSQLYTVPFVPTVTRRGGTNGRWDVPHREVQDPAGLASPIDRVDADDRPPRRAATP